MKVDVVQVPYDSGHRGLRMGAGPLRIVEAGFLDGLASAGHDVELVPIELNSSFPGEVASAFQLARSIRERVASARSRDRLPIVLAGNCMAALGSVAALGQPHVYWFDAHADLNTPETTRSGFVDGMALSVLLGRCWGALADELGLEPIPEEAISLIGARDLDPAEEAFLASSAVGRFGPRVDPVALVHHGTRSSYLHIDLDVLDPEVGTANQFSSAGGLSLDHLLNVLRHITEQRRPGAVTLSAYDPAADQTGAIARAALRIGQLITSAAGERT